MEDLRTILPRSLQQALPVMTRTNSYNFCPPSHSDPLHYEKSFPWLFPYSRGGPDDHIAKSRTKMQTFGEYTKQGLLQGFHADGRRMFIFTAYYNEQRRIIGSVAHQATKSKSAGASTRSSTAPGPESDMSIQELDQVRIFLHSDESRGPTREPSKLLILIAITLKSKMI